MFHLTEDGEVKQCMAKSPELCPVRNIFGAKTDHYVSSSVAKIENEKQLSLKCNPAGTLKVKKKPESKHSSSTYNELSENEYKEFLKYRKIKNYFDLNSKQFFLVMSQYNAQAKSKWIEQYIAYNLDLELVPASLDRGDAKDINDKHYEFKTSTTNKGKNLNLRQIRLYQDVDYYICSYIEELDLKQSSTFFLTKSELKKELKLVNGVDSDGKIKGFTHGTIAANKNNKTPEYSLTIPINEDNENFKRWKESYWFDPLYDVLIK